MRNLVHGSPTRLAQFLMIGAKITTTGVLFRNAENALTSGSTRICALATVAPAPGSSLFTTSASAPLWRTPSLTRKSRPTVIMPRLLNPATICLGEMMPAAMNTTTTESSTMPGRILSRMSATSIPASTKITNAISKFIVCQADCPSAALRLTINQGLCKSSLLYISGLPSSTRTTSQPAASAMAWPAAVSHSIVGAKRG